jgi:hypothetical protein
MPNDLAEVIKHIEAYYAEDEAPVTEAPTPEEIEPTVEELNGTNN